MCNRNNGQGDKNNVPSPSRGNIKEIRDGVGSAPRTSYDRPPRPGKKNG